MRLQGNKIGTHIDELRVFSDWILAIGDGIVGTSVQGNEKVQIPDDLLIKQSVDPTSVIVERLCNGTRFIITKLGNQVIEAKVLVGQMAGQKVFIPRMTLTLSDARIPFKFQRRQFPITVSFAMTLNKSQGQSLSHVGLFLKKPVFTHGQLYVALSRVTRRKGLKILVCDADG
ncbi:PREDICTED: ATP-dependent DNA helicase PIF1-like [Nicotiana attenuata]|uniref:ATP-dependent DNA helicase PIF1-like n=1 Tax=Nicotiana attenuata TaxID=49451 RepID=UPI0009055D93|nr:PREDICTED: ATP-dependent DNA helicase PIF1-like [Nicotiana attenuata]